MTFAEKLMNLRTSVSMSQEELAEKLKVSRQTVSKWETGQTVPQIEMVLLLCDYFSISADDLLRDEIIIHRGADPVSTIKDSGDVKNKYFGTDGFRGEANKTLTALHAFKVGRFLGWYYRSPLSGKKRPGDAPRIVIGKDTRRSSYMLEYAIVAGITSSGADAYMLHVTTTPSISYVTRVDKFDCGIMITASHNPFFDNGIKIVNSYGEKLDDRTTALVEKYIDGDLGSLGISGDDLPLAHREKIGKIVDYIAGRNRYVGYLISLAAHSYRELKIGLDCANGASWMIAKSVFEALGAHVYLIGCEPDGTNANQNCGSTHIGALVDLVTQNHLDVGFAFDGDADRCIAVDENGKIVDGDKIIYILAVRLKDRGILDHNTVVTTIMSNSGLTKALAKNGIKNEQTTVGDRFVYERMLEGGFRLGGEQSGHIILKKYATTGDGILTAIMLTEEMRDRKQKLSAMAAPVIPLPQMTKNLKVTSKSGVVKDVDVNRRLDEINSELIGNGRILLRQSGTEPVIRIMTECENEKSCSEYIARLESVIRKKGFICE